MSEELKKEWEREFEHQFQEFAPDGSAYGAGLRIIHTGTTDDREILDNIKSFISSLLAKQQAENQKIIDGIFEIKEKELARQKEEFVKCIPEEKRVQESDDFGALGYNQCIADIKSKLK